MHSLAFQALLAKRQELIQQVLEAKAKGISLGGDRLHNFKIAAHMAGITPEQALMSMDLKHRVCIEDMVEQRVPLTAELITEKIGDHINYMILLEALLTEKLEQLTPGASLNVRVQGHSKQLKVLSGASPLRPQHKPAKVNNHSNNLPV